MGKNRCQFGPVAALDNNSIIVNRKKTTPVEIAATTQATT